MSTFRPQLAKLNKEIEDLGDDEEKRKKFLAEALVRRDERYRVLSPTFIVLHYSRRERLQRLSQSGLLHWREGKNRLRRRRARNENSSKPQM